MEENIHDLLYQSCTQTLRHQRNQDRQDGWDDIRLFPH